MVSGFDVGSSVNSAADWACGAPVVRSVVGNPMLVSLIITVIAVIIVLSVYYGAGDKKTFKSGVRSSMYVFIAVTIIMFLHHYTVSATARESSAQKDVRNVFDEIQLSRAAGLPAGAPYIGGDGGRHDNIGGHPSYTGGHPGFMGGQLSGQPGFMSGHPGFMGGQLSGQPGYTGHMGGQPGYTGYMGGQPSYTSHMSGQPSYTGHMGGQPSYTSHMSGHQPGHMGGQPSHTSGHQPSHTGGQPSHMSGQHPSAADESEFTLLSDVVVPTNQVDPTRARSRSSRRDRQV